MLWLLIALGFKGVGNFFITNFPSKIKFLKFKNKIIVRDFLQKLDFEIQHLFFLEFFFQNYFF